MPNPEIGSIGWCDLTVARVDAIRDFYGAVACALYEAAD